MAKNRNILLGSLIISLVVFSTCKKPNGGMDEASAGNGPSAVVVFSVGEAKVLHSDLTEEKAELGTALKSGDKIATATSGKVDIQFADGSAIRISENSNVSFDTLAINEKGNTETKVALVSGKVFAKVQKARKDDEFSVVTPTAIAGVRGTSFVVDRTNGKNATVKVMDGAVAVAPRIPALESASAEEIEKDPKLKELKASLDKAEVVLQKNEASEIVADDERLSSKDLSSMNKASVAEMSKVSEKSVKKLDSSNISKSDEQEMSTIVTVEKSTLNKMVELSEEMNGPVDPEKAKALEVEKQKLEEQLAQKQKDEQKKFNATLVENPKPLKSKKDIVNYYERIEKIVMTDGSSLVGAIVNQEGTTMIVHTEQGIKKINQKDVREVIYDFQTQVKF